MITDYDYDAAGNLKHKLQPDGSGYVYYYNLPGRLDRIEYIDSNLDANDVGRYLYDALGRRFEKFTPAGATNTTRFWYDLSGRLLAEFDENGVILMEYIYLDGRPIAISGSDRDGDGVEDAFDNCVAEADTSQTDTNGDGYGNVCDPDLNNDGIVNTVDLGILRSKFFTNDPDADLNLDGVVNTVDLGILKQFMFGPPGPAAPASGVNNALGTDLKYIHANHLDKPMAVFDQQKNLDWEIDESPFGRKSSVSASSLVFNLRFPGQYFDDESDLSYNYHRYYDPATGRYITSDPIGLAGGINTYGYALQNPLFYFDPTGENPLALIGFAVGALSGFIAGANSPCADFTSIFKSTIAGGIVGSVSASFGVAGTAAKIVTRGQALLRSAAAGGLGNTAGQIVTNNGIRGFSPGQAFTQGAVGALSGGLGRISGFYSGLTRLRYLIRTRQAAGALSRALALGDRNATVVATASNALANAVISTELGGSLRPRSGCHCKR